MFWKSMGTPKSFITGSLFTPIIPVQKVLIQIQKETP